MAVRDQFAVEPPILHFVGVLSRKKTVSTFSVRSTHWPGNGVCAIYSTFTLVYIIPFMIIHACMQGIGRVDVLILSTCTPAAMLCTVDSLARMHAPRQASRCITFMVLS